MRPAHRVQHAILLEDAPAFNESGTGDQWREHVGKLCLANSRLMLAASMSFAAPLLHLTGTEPGGVHLFGTSSCGKSTAQAVAASVSGPPEHYMKTWHSTGAAIEAIAAQYNDMLLILDELGVCSGEAAASTAYTLSNGQGKNRSTQHGGLQNNHKFRVLLLSSGECSFPDFLHKKGITPFAGQELRLPDVPADAGCDMGLFEHIHDSPDPTAFSDRLKLNTRLYHGVVFFEYMQRLVDDINNNHDGIMKRISRYMDELLDMTTGTLPPESRGQVNRVAARFAIIAAGGELASHYGVTGWEAKEALWSAKVCFNAWLAQRDTSGQQENYTLIQQVRAFFNAHGESRFTPLEGDHRGPARVTINRAGWRRTTVNADNDRTSTEYYVTPSAFKEMVTGFDYKWAAKVLVREGMVKQGTTSSVSKNEYISGEGSPRVYTFPAAKEEPDSETVN